MTSGPRSSVLFSPNLDKDEEAAAAAAAAAAEKDNEIHPDPSTILPRPALPLSSPSPIQDHPVAIDTPGNSNHDTQRNFIQRLSSPFRRKGPLQPFRLLRQDLRNLTQRYTSDWTVFNQLVLASAVYVFFTNLLPGITFASDLYELTGKNWGSVEIVLSTGLCGVIFAV